MICAGQPWVRDEIRPMSFCLVCFTSEECKIPFVVSHPWHLILCRYIDCLLTLIRKISMSDEARRRTGIHKLELSVDDTACTRLPPPVQADRQIATPKRRKRVQYTYNQINPVYAEREGRVAEAGQLYLHKNLGLSGLVPGLPMQQAGTLGLRYMFSTEKRGQKIDLDLSDVLDSKLRKLIRSAKETSHEHNQDWEHEKRRAILNLTSADHSPSVFLYTVLYCNRIVTSSLQDVS